MTDYISREAALEAIQRLVDTMSVCVNRDECNGRRIMKQMAIAAIRLIPAADVREVVTCEECDWHVDACYHFCNKWCVPCPDDSEFFCAYGERRGAEMKGEADGT